MTFLDIKVVTCLHLIIPCKFCKHSVVVRGIVAGDMANLLVVNLSPSELSSGTHPVDNSQSKAYLVERLPKTSAIVRGIHLRKSKETAF